MDSLNELFPNIAKYAELLPVLLMGILSGVVSYFNKDGDRGAVRESIKAIITCAFLAVVTYAMLSASELPYLAKVGLSCAVGYFGIDKAIEIVQKLINLKNNAPKDSAPKQS